MPRCSNMDLSLRQGKSKFSANPKKNQHFRGILHAKAAPIPARANCALQ
jgi:hypothetical protein